MSDTPKELSKRAKSSRFVSLTSTAEHLYALDNNGRVWRYYPAGMKRDGTTPRYAFWGSLTTHRAPPDA